MKEDKNKFLLLLDPICALYLNRACFGISKLSQIQRKAWSLL